TTNASTATTTVIVTQAGTGEALISTTSNIEFDYEAIETAALVVPVLSDNTTITKVVSSASWLTVTLEDGDESFSYKADANPSTDGTSRIATITVTAKNGDTYATSYITVTQGAAEVVEPTVVTLTAPEATIYVDYTEQPVSFSVASTTTEAEAATITASCATATVGIAESGDVTVALVANESTTSSITHSVIVTATLNGVAVSKVVTIVQSATPTADATVVTLTAPEATISVDAAEQNVSFSVASTTTEAYAATITASCATAKVEIAESGDVTVALVANELTTSSITHSVIVTATSTDGTAVSKVVTIEQAAAIAADATVVTLSVPGSPISVPSYSEIYSLDVYGTTTEESGSLTFTAESASDGIKALTITDGSTTDNTTAVLKIEYDTNLSDEAITFIVKVTATSTDGTSKSAFITYVQNAYAESGTPAVKFAADPDAEDALAPSVLYNVTSATMYTTSSPENTIAASVAYTAEYSAGWIKGYSYDAATGQYTFTVSELATTQDATSYNTDYTQESYTYNSDRTAEVTLVATTSEGVTEKLSAKITQQAYHYSLYYSSEEGSVYTSASETVTADATSLTVSNVVLFTNSLVTPVVTSNAGAYDWITGVTYDNSEFTVTMEQNTTTTDRTATLVVSIEVDGVTKSLQIVVTQEATTASITISSSKGGSSDNPATTSRNSVDISLTPSESVSSFLNTNNNIITTSIVSVTNVVDTGDVPDSNGLTVSYTYKNGDYTIYLDNWKGLTNGTTYAVEILITSTSGTTTNLSETITVYVEA
ncbi:MAG: BACON domain-containing carbohydrate-binding protein, partial [Rikenellaceae bacterium]